jgi:2-phospho-L-lactate/phosphoenolpyruvate guanylyltransferase
MTAAAVIPVKPIDRALGRLASVLSPGERRDLQSAMLLDLLDACRDSAAVAATFVVTADAAAAELSRAAGARVLWDHVPPRGMNPAVAIGQAEVEDRLIDAALILTADLPLVRSQDLDAIVAALRPGRGAVLVPSRDGTGTNALALAPPFGIATRLGANSRALHEYALQNAGIAFCRLEIPSLALDVDTPADLLALARCDDDGRAALCCAAWGLADRLGVGVVR